MIEEHVTVTYSADVRARLEDAIENCLFMFNTMSRMWPPEQNIKAAKDSIMAEIIHTLELPDIAAEED